MLASLELAILAKWLSDMRFVILEKLRMFWGAPILVFSIYCSLLSLFLPWLIRDSFVAGTVRVPDALEDVIHRYTHEGDQVLMLSMWISPTYSVLVHSNRLAASRYLWAYPLRMYEYLQYQSTNPVEIAKYRYEEREVAEEIYDDIRKNHPTLIAIEPSSLKWDRGWTIFSYLENHGLEQVLDNYMPTRSGNAWLIWTLKRKEL